MIPWRGLSTHLWAGTDKANMTACASKARCRPTPESDLATDTRRWPCAGVLLAIVFDAGSALYQPWGGVLCLLVKCQILVGEAVLCKLKSEPSRNLRVLRGSQETLTYSHRYLKVIYHPLYGMNNYVLIWGDWLSCDPLRGSHDSQSPHIWGWLATTWPSQRDTW